jgi:hypothetical protein
VFEALVGREHAAVEGEGHVREVATEPMHHCPEIQTQQRRLAETDDIRQLTPSRLE